MCNFISSVNSILMEDHTLIYIKARWDYGIGENNYEIVFWQKYFSVFFYSEQNLHFTLFDLSTSSSAYLHICNLIFSPTRPKWAELVIESPCSSVCLCHRETPTSGGRVDLWSKIAFLILVWDDKIFKKRGGQIFFRDC